MPDDEGHPAVEEMRLGPVLAALADPLRRRVVRELAAAPDGTARTCSSFALPVSKATVTHHFRALREAGLIQQVSRGNSRMASLRRADLEQRFPGLLGMVAAEPEG
ncbi:helix-turn-helix domain-containing protein [Streptomyces sp. NPDC047525]|uniref:ArsR/SmtB family transcription factor n=1 Tax=Streptomyces sp. NPDC047525 TaxID=3155264 RepID=UPI0033D584B1